MSNRTIPGLAVYDDAIDEALIFTDAPCMRAVEDRDLLAEIVPTTDHNVAATVHAICYPSFLTGTSLAIDPRNN